VRIQVPTRCSNQPRGLSRVKKSKTNKREWYQLTAMQSPNRSNKPPEDVWEVQRSMLVEREDGISSQGYKFPRSTANCPKASRDLGRADRPVKGEDGISLQG
jgi:hypothetical protein